MMVTSALLWQEMIEEVDRMDAGSMVSVGEAQATVEEYKVSLTNIFTLFMDFVDQFVNRVKEEQRSHQAVLRQIIEVAKNGGYS